MWQCALSVSYQIVMGHRSKPFACILILMFRKWFHSLTYGFKRFHFTSVSRFLESHGVQFRALHPPSWCLFELSFRMAWSLPRVFPTYSSNFWKFLCNLCHQDHEVNSSWSSSIIELRLLVFSIPVFVDSERFTIFSFFWPHVITSGGRMNVCQPPPRTHMYPLRGFSFGRVNFVKAVPRIW